MYKLEKRTVVHSCTSHLISWQIQLKFPRSENPTNISQRLQKNRAQHFTFEQLKPEITLNVNT